MVLDDDFKISMDDIKDIVSELFGEKIEKVDEAKAKEILKKENKISLDEDLANIQIGQLTQEEEKILKDYEEDVKKESENKIEIKEETQIKETTDINALKKKIEEEMREKLRKEFEEERAKKREEVLKKLDEIKETEKIQQPQVKVLTNYSEKISLLQIFEQSQNILKNLLSKLIKRNPVETMFLKTLEKAIQKHPDVLRKSDFNQFNKVRVDGSIEIGRVAANLNSIYMPEDKKEIKFFNVLHDIFEERLIAIELAVGIETKDEIISKLIGQVEEILKTKNISTKLINIFMGKIVPSTTMKLGE